MPPAAARCSSSPPAATRTASSTSTRSRPSASQTSSTRRSGAHALATALDELPAEDLPAVDGRRRVASRRAGARLALVRARAPRGRDRGRRSNGRESDYSGRQFRGASRDRNLAVGRSFPATCGRAAPPAVLARRRAVLPQPRLLRPDRRSRRRRRRRTGAPAPHGVVDPGAAREGVRRRRRTSRRIRTVDLIGARGAIVDDHGRLLAGTTGHVVIDADAASLGTRDAHGVLHPSPAGVCDLAPRPVRRTAQGQILARIKHDVLQAPFAPAVVVDEPEPGARRTTCRSAGRGSPASRSRSQPSRSYPLGAFGSDVPRPARPDQPEELQVARLRERAGGRGRRSERRRGGVRLDPQHGLPQAQDPSRLARASIAGPLVVPKEKAAADAAALDRHASPAATRGRARLRDGRGAHSPATPDRRLRGRDRPVDGRDQGDRELSDVQREARGDELELPQRSSTTTRLGTPTLNRAITGAYPTGSTFKPIIAEAALSGGIITPYTPQLCSGSFVLGNHTFFNVERGVYEIDGSADGARAVVRHVVLPARRPDLGRRSRRRRRR